MDVKGQVAIITGASSGIGKAVASALAGLGVRLVITARREQELSKLSESLKGCVYLAGSIDEKDMPGKLLKKALDEFGRCDIVFNSAGIMHAASIDDTDIDQMCKMVRVNLESAIRLSYVFLKHFKRSDSGYLINVSSILGVKVRPNTGVYAATKFGIEAFSEAIRMEVAQTNIKVSVIEPGVTDTELQDHFAVHPKQLLGITKPLVAGDVANTVVFLLQQPEHVRIPVMMILPGQQPM